jgi:endogenous inhibitor of DNA gyrase (YacG/DUF329 family)
MALITCPTCGQRFDSDGAAKTMPFCCERCQKIDLGRWLDEQIGMPLEPEDVADAAPDQREFQAGKSQTGNSNDN